VRSRGSEPAAAEPAAAFDVIGTLFSLDRTRQALAALGAPPTALDLWFAQGLRDAFAWSHAGQYRPLRDVLGAALPRTLRRMGVEVGSSESEIVMRTFAELDPAPGAAEACRELAERGWRLMTLTNGGDAPTRELLARSGLAGYFTDVLSCDAVRKTKPHPDTYRMARERAASDELWMIAAHAWDVAGASAAGLRTAWVGSMEGEYLSIYPEPNIRADDLLEAARAILAVHGRSSGG